MTRALFWEPANHPGTKIADDPDIEAVIGLRQLNETFGSARHRLNPVELTKTHVFTLRQLAAGRPTSMFAVLADLIHDHGTIRVWGVDV